MKALVAIILLAGALAPLPERDRALVLAQADVSPAPKAGGWFTTVDIVIDSKDKPLAVYQFEFKAKQGNVKIVGVEGGEHHAFRKPPYYDQQAIQRQRVIIAAFTTADADALPTGKTRVATLHLHITGNVEPKYEVKLDVSATVGGERISATAAVQTKGTRP